MQNRSLHVPEATNAKLTDETLQEKNNENRSQTARGSHLRHQSQDTLACQLFHEFIILYEVIASYSEQRERPRRPQRPLISSRPDGYHLANSTTTPPPP
jgi:hypothetical protein